MLVAAILALLSGIFIFFFPIVLIMGGESSERVEELFRQGILPHPDWGIALMIIGGILLIIEMLRFEWRHLNKRNNSS